MIYEVSAHNQNETTIFVYLFLFSDNKTTYASHVKSSLNRNKSLQLPVFFIKLPNVYSIRTSKVNHDIEFIKYGKLELQTSTTQLLCVLFKTH